MTTNTTFPGFSNTSITTTGTNNTNYGPYGPNGYHNPRNYSHISYINLFTHIKEMFELSSIDEKQLVTLNELYDSGDESNKKIAVELFKYLMKEDKKEVDEK